MLLNCGQDEPRPPCELVTIAPGSKAGPHPRRPRPRRVGNSPKAAVVHTMTKSGSTRPGSAAFFCGDHRLCPLRAVADGHQRSPAVKHGPWKSGPDLVVRRRNRDRPAPRDCLPSSGRKTRTVIGTLWPQHPRLRCGGCIASAQVHLAREVRHRQPDAGAGPGLLPHGLGQPGRDPRSSARGLRPGAQAPTQLAAVDGDRLPARARRLHRGAVRGGAAPLALDLLADPGGLPGRRATRAGGHLAARWCPVRQRARLVCRVPGAHRGGPARHRARHAGRLPALRRLGSLLNGRLGHAWGMDQRITAGTKGGIGGLSRLVSRSLDMSSIWKIYREAIGAAFKSPHLRESSLRSLRRNLSKSR
jgi:hypothetical protein